MRSILGRVFEQKSGGRSSAFDDLTLNAQLSPQFEDVSLLTRQLLTLGDVRIASISRFFLTATQAACGRPALCAVTSEPAPPVYGAATLAVASLRSLTGRARSLAG